MESRSITDTADRDDPDAATRRLRETLDLSQFGVAMMREYARREHPAADDEALTDLVNQRLKELHVDEFADGPFRVVRWPRLNA